MPTDVASLKKKIFQRVFFRSSYNSCIKSHGGSIYSFHQINIPGACLPKILPSLNADIWKSVCLFLWACRPGLSLCYKDFYGNGLKNRMYIWLLRSRIIYIACPMFAYFQNGRTFTVLVPTLSSNQNCRCLIEAPSIEVVIDNPLDLTWNAIPDWKCMHNVSSRDSSSVTSSIEFLGGLASMEIQFLDWFDVTLAMQPLQSIDFPGFDVHKLTYDRQSYILNVQKIGWKQLFV